MDIFVPIISLLCTLITVLVWRIILKHEQPYKLYSISKVDILWKERQKQRCKDNIHIEEDWQMQTGSTPFIRCKHCFKIYNKEGK